MTEHWLLLLKKIILLLGLGLIRLIRLPNHRSRLGENRRDLIKKKEIYVNLGRVLMIII